MSSPTEDTSYCETWKALRVYVSCALWPFWRCNTLRAPWAVVSDNASFGKEPHTLSTIVYPLPQSSYIKKTLPLAFQSSGRVFLMQKMEQKTYNCMDNAWSFLANDALFIVTDHSTRILFQCQKGDIAGGSHTLRVVRVSQFPTHSWLPERYSVLFWCNLIHILRSFMKPWWTPPSKNACANDTNEKNKMDDAGGSSRLPGTPRAVHQLHHRKEKKRRGGTEKTIHHRHYCFDNRQIQLFQDSQ